MGLDDVTYYTDHIRQAEVRMERSPIAGERAARPDIILIAKSNATAVKEQPAQRAEINNLGQIGNIKLPAGWIEGQPEPYTEIGARYYRWFHPGKDEKTRICFFYRGLRVETPTAQAFHKVLAQAPHKLTADELKSIRDVLRDMGDPKDFQMKNCSSVDLNGKRVLLVEGLYKELQHDTYQIFIDADGTGEVVQEVYFIAPKEQFAANLAVAKPAIDGIRWKKK